MNKLLNKIKSKSFWKEGLETAKLFAIIDYLIHLNNDGNYIGYCLVIFIFGFQPVYKLIKAKPWQKK